MVNFISTVIFDGLVLTLTVYRTGRLAIQSKRNNFGETLSLILLRDGMCSSVRHFRNDVNLLKGIFYYVFV